MMILFSRIGERDEQVTEEKVRLIVSVVDAIGRFPITGSLAAFAAVGAIEIFEQPVSNKPRSHVIFWADGSERDERG